MIIFFNSLDHFGNSSLNRHEGICIFSVIAAPKLSRIIKVGLSQCRYGLRITLALLLLTLQNIPFKAICALRWGNRIKHSSLPVYLPTYLSINLSNTIIICLYIYLYSFLSLLIYYLLNYLHIFFFVTHQQTLTWSFSSHYTQHTCDYYLALSRTSALPERTRAL